MDYYIRKLKVKSLFNESSHLTIDFDEKINCLYGVNGSGKTTIINLLVASLYCDIYKLANLSFSEVIIYVALNKKKKAAPFFSVKRFESNLTYEFYSDFTETENQVLIDFSFPMKREIDRGDEKKRIFVTDLIKRFVTVTHVPLSRMHDSDIYEFAGRSDDMVLNLAMRSRQIPLDEMEDFLDPSRRMLLKLEANFKQKYAETQKEINKDLDSLKDTLLEKMLINRVFANKYSKQSISVHQKKLTNPNFEEYSKKLRASNLRISDAALREHFEIMEETISNLNKIRDEYQAVMNSSDGSDNVSKDKLQKAYSVEAAKYRVLNPIYERFFDVLDDVEDIQYKKEEFLKPFTTTAALINEFLVNKEFSFNPTGGFEIKCGNRAIKLADLSSGEKHMIALLGRVALSPEQGAVFVADEPELSLHLEWQRKILPAIQSLSPNIQIIVATHSPAIIPKEAKLIDLEECVK